MKLEVSSVSILFFKMFQVRTHYRWGCSGCVSFGVVGWLVRLHSEEVSFGVLPSLSLFRTYKLDKAPLLGKEERKKKKRKEKVVKGSASGSKEGNSMEFGDDLSHLRHRAGCKDVHSCHQLQFR